MRDQRPSQKDHEEKQDESESDEDEGEIDQTQFFLQLRRLVLKTWIWIELMLWQLAATNSLKLLNWKLSKIEIHG